MNDKKRENETDKITFLETFLNVIQKCILKCNYIIKNENQNYVDPNTYKKFQYPSIQSAEKTDDNQINFLIEINELYNTIKNKIDTDKSINENDLSDKLITSFNNMFNGKIQLNNNINDIIKNIDDDNSFYSDEKGESDENESDEENENSTKDNSEDKFYYIVNIINKENYMFEDVNYNKQILEKISNVLSTNINNITLLTNRNSIFVNDFIKTQKFAKFPPKIIRTQYPSLPSLYDFKIILDGLIRLKCKIPLEYLDYKYNFISPNLSLTNKRGSEKYDPPYGWLGIGLNVINIYDNVDNSWLRKDNDSWAIAYYGFGKYLSSEEIGNMLNDAIVKGVFKRELSIKCKDFDIRHISKTIGEGIYLSPNVNIAEKNSGTFVVNNKKYNIVLMAKVLIKNIREPEDHSFWVLDGKDIRIYRILVKEKK
jgi:hypothetical protein